MIVFIKWRLSRVPGKNSPLNIAAVLWPKSALGGNLTFLSTFQALQILYVLCKFKYECFRQKEAHGSGQDVFLFFF